ncbi:hypothetical protein AYO20_05082 [Fonsecaea nubica]|uniref:Uncharacterized protein n=1 Tax=Fonsecaea nubica TaxID=856822 RepID=A0A178D3E8_9EURO|nr:hypothetical protein AYO20_05082 [Fonsecaea nubica]OAL35701.1 hypothetical protein AYO20_05082 [Fonsecaea nubica]
MTFMSTFPSHLTSQRQPQTFPEAHAIPQSQLQPGSRPRRRTTQASTATQSSTSTRSLKFFRSSTKRSASVFSSSSSSSETSDSVKEERRVRRWGRKAIKRLERAFSAYPQGTSVGLVWTDQEEAERMVTTVVETGGTSPAAATTQQRSRSEKSLWDKLVDVFQLDDMKDINWSTSTLGMETGLNMSTRQGFSIEDAREIPLSSLPWMPPPPSPALLPSSRSSRRRDTGRINTERRTYRDRDWEYQTYGAWVVF